MHSYFDAYRFVVGVVSPYFSREDLINLLKKNENYEWEMAAQIAGNHSIVQAIYPALVDKKLINYIPNDFISYIKEMNLLNCKRNLLMKSQLMKAVSIINELGVKPLLMKGAAHYFLNTFSSEGERLLTDLDILVPKDKIEYVSNGLINSGYRYDEDKLEFIQTHHHYPPLIKNDECAMIELHRDLMFREQQHIFPNELAWGKSIDITLPNNSKAKVLTPTYRVFHSFLHSTMVDGLHQKGFVEIRQLHELTKAQHTYASDIDWQEMFVLAHEHNIDRQLCANLHSAVEFMNFPKIKEIANVHTMLSKFHHYRVCSKLKYAWFNSLDKRLVKRMRHFKSKWSSEPALAPANG